MGEPDQCAGVENRLAQQRCHLATPEMSGVAIVKERKGMPVRWSRRALRGRRWRVLPRLVRAVGIFLLPRAVGSAWRLPAISHASPPHANARPPPQYRASIGRASVGVNSDGLK